MAPSHRRRTRARRTTRATLEAAPSTVLATGTHRRETRARRATATLVAVPLTVLATSGAVALGVTAPQLGSAQEEATGSGGPSTQVSRSADVVSRSQARQAAARSERYLEQRQAARAARQAAYAERQTQRAIRGAHEHRWTTAPLNLWTGPEGSATQVGLVDEGEKVLTTGRRSGDRAELVVDGKARWVTAAYLSEEKPPPAPKPSESPSATPTETPSASPSPSETTSTDPAPATPAGLSTAPCPDGSVENGLTSEAVAVYRAVCHAFPEVETYLGYDAHGEHASGQAIDIMTSDKALGDQIAAFLQSHAAELDLYDIIWWDRIWTPVRASEGWRDYGDHGSPTANHMDHVHVATNS